MRELGDLSRIFGRFVCFGRQDLLANILEELGVQAMSGFEHVLSYHGKNAISHVTCGLASLAIAESDTEIILGKIHLKIELKI